MIIGSGNIAKVIDDREGVIFFASGNSNSGCTDENEFEREISLLYKTIYDFPSTSCFHLVYFSSLGIYINDNAHFQHKKRVEKIIKTVCRSYTIVRIGVIEWGKNPTTIHNVFKRKLANNEPIEIQDTYRWLNTLEEFKYWLGKIRVGEKEEMNITGKLVKVSEILEMVKDGRL